MVIFAAIVVRFRLVTPDREILDVPLPITSSVRLIIISTYKSYVTNNLTWRITSQVHKTVLY
jgi:hypothetical protein